MGAEKALFYYYEVYLWKLSHFHLNVFLMVCEQNHKPCQFYVPLKQPL